MPEAGPETAIKQFRDFLDGDERRPGLVPWDLDAGVEPPPGVELRYRREDQVLWVYFREHGVRVRYRWDGFRWIEEASDDAPEGEDISQELAALGRAIRQLEGRIARLEHLLKRCLEGRG